MPDNNQESGPRDQLVRVRCRGSHNGFEPAPHRSVFRYRSSICSGARPRHGGRRHFKCQLPCPDLVQAHGQGSPGPSPPDRRPPTNTKGSTQGRRNNTANKKPTTATSGTRQWGKNTNLAKARRIAGIARFLSATDSVSYLPRHDMILALDALRCVTRKTDEI